MRSTNPALSGGLLRNIQSQAGVESRTMTAAGTGIKTAFALAILIGAAAFTWNMVTAGQNPRPIMIGGGIVGLILALATMFKPHWARFTVPFYAAAEGLFLGGISAMIQSAFPDVSIVANAVCLTFGTLFTMLVGYQSGWIRMSEKFRAGILAATGGVFLVYLISMGMSMFGMGGLSFIHSSGPLGIGFSVFVVVLAALHLVLDFDMIDRMVAGGAPKQYEWYGAFALLVTLVWLYMEILRLLAKLQSRD